MSRHQKILQNLLAGSQTLPYHPIMKEPEELRGYYYRQLEKSIVQLRWRKHGWVQAELDLYRSYMFSNPLTYDGYSHVLPDNYAWLLVMDLALISGYNKRCLSSKKMKNLASKLCCGSIAERQCLADYLLSSLVNHGNAMNNLQNELLSFEFCDYLSRIHNNMSFIQEVPYKILVTATMSAGKSSVVNALIGKEICKAGNLACTDKINLVIGKNNEDNLVYLKNDILTLDADNDKVLHGNVHNAANHAVISTFFHGHLGGIRIVIKDSPGINSSMNDKHRKITEQEVKQMD